MMHRREAAILALAVLAALGAAIRIVRSDDAVIANASSIAVVSSDVPTVDDDSLGEAAANAAANDPFRLVNRPSSVRYDARNENGAVGQTPVFVAPRPQLLLKAIVGGPPWQAIVDGIPGQPPGTIVRSGNAFDKLTVRNVGRDTVVIQTPDTTWKLTLTRDHQ